MLVSRTQEYSHADAPADLSKNTGSLCRASGDNRRGPHCFLQGLGQFPIAESATVHGDGTPIASPWRAPRCRAVWPIAPCPSSCRMSSALQAEQRAGYPLLAGPMDVLRRGAFHRPLPCLVPAGGRFELSFGLEERLRVKRVVIDGSPATAASLATPAATTTPIASSWKAISIAPMDRNRRAHPGLGACRYPGWPGSGTSAGWKLNAPTAS